MNSNNRDGKPAAPERITPSWRPRQVEKSAPCQAGCVNCGDIRSWIGAVAQRHKTGISREESFARAWRQIADVNPFPATLGRICPHPCENHCNRADQDEALAINELERFLGDYAIAADLSLPLLRSRTESESIGVIGAGPSGLSFAYQMARRGYSVTVYDARKKAGGMLRYGVPDYRLPQEVLDAEIEKIVELGVDIHLNTMIGRDIELAELRTHHEHLYLGIGAQKGRQLRIPGADGPAVWNGTDYLEKLNRGQPVDLGSRVVVVGGGNTALDAARSARRLGARVTILYRRTMADMPAIEEEIQEAVEEGVEIRLLTTPVRIEREADGRMKSVIACHMAAGLPDSSGRARPETVEGTEFSIAADALIAAISQRPLLDGLDGLRQDHGWLVADESGVVDEQIWTGGDASGLGVAGDAIVQGRNAAELLHARLRGQDCNQSSEAQHTEISAQEIRLESKPEGLAVYSPRPVGSERVARGMKEFSSTISETQFLHEIERCHSCGSCFGCEQCFMYCTSNCFTRLEEPKPGFYFTLNLDECRECGKCIEVCPCGFLEAD